MLRIEYERQRKLRENIDKVQKLLVDIEEAYGSEMIPVCNLWYSEEKGLVTVDDVVVESIKEVKTREKKKRTALRNMLPSFPTVPQMYAELTDETITAIKIEDTVVTEISVSVYDWDDQMTALQEDVFYADFDRYIPLITEGVTFWTAAARTEDRLLTAEQAVKDFRRNELAQEVMLETGEVISRADVSMYDWDSREDTLEAIEVMKSQINLCLQQAKALKYSWLALKENQEYTQSLNQAHNGDYIKRMAALRVGTLLDDNMKFTVLDIQDNDICVISVDGTKMSAIVKESEERVGVTVEDIMPVDYEAYFKVNKAADEFYKRDTRKTPQQLLESHSKLKPWQEQRCVSCGNTASSDFCDFCINEE